MTTITTNQSYLQAVNRRRTCAIISHPDAGKTTVTNQMLLLGQPLSLTDVISNQATVRHPKSDWMEIEKQRGISITTSVMQFYYGGCLINLLDTPGHEDFSEDTYRTLTAVDCCFMVIDAAKGVEERTRKLMEVARLRNTPIITFINKLDRDARNPIDLLDQIEHELSIICTPITWPIGCGKLFQGIYHFYENRVYLYRSGREKGAVVENNKALDGLNQLDNTIGSVFSNEVSEEVALISGAVDKFRLDSFLSGQSTPVFFGTALGNFGINHLLDALVTWGPPPQFRLTNERMVYAEEAQFSGFIFKIQANMDPKHRDRVAFMRIVSGRYQKGMKLFHVRLKKYIIISDALTLMAGEREHIEEAYAGDIIGLHNHGTIQIGDTFTQYESIKFIGIPNFAPELFKRIRLRDPLKQKQLLKGIIQLAEEGAVQFFRPLLNNDLIIGAVGLLQFDIVVARLKLEYSVEAVYESVDIVTARWISGDDAKKMNEFKGKYASHLALDGNGCLTYIASSRVQLSLIQERHPEINFSITREH